MNHKFLMGGLGALVLGGLPMLAVADTASRNYISVQWLFSGEIEEGGFSEDISGYRLMAMKSFGDYVFFSGRSNAYDFEQGGADADLSTDQIGIGGRFPFHAGPVGLSVWGSANYERLSLGGAVGTGPGVDLGFRVMPVSRLDIGLTAKVFGEIDFDGFTEDFDWTGYELDVAYAITSGIAVSGSFGNYTLEPDTGDELEYSDLIGVGVRFGF